MRTNAFDDEQRRAPSREEIESLCILDAVGDDGCEAGELAARLGLSPTIAYAVAEGAAPLIGAGLLERRGDRFTLTDSGYAWLRERLTELDVERTRG